MDVFFAVLFFAFSTTITPGPNNIMMLSSGVNYSVKASLPHFFGICLGFPCMGVWLTCGALLRTLLNQPLYQRILNWAMALLLALSVGPVLAELYAEWML